MRTSVPAPRGRKTRRARTVRAPGWSMRTRSRGSRGATTTFGATVKIEATGRAGFPRASAAPYSEPPVGDGAGVPPAYATAAGASPIADAATAAEIPASTRFRPMPRTVDPPRRPVNRPRANAQVHGPELAPRAPPARRRPETGAKPPVSVVEPGEHPAHHLERARLVERLVEVAALRRLHARRAARLARALCDERVRIAHQGLEAQEPLAGDPDAAGVAVVDEDRRPPGLRVEVRRQPADVPAVAHREQRQDRDLRVLRRVQRAEQNLQGEVVREQVVGHLVPERLRAERLRRQVERLQVD